MFSDIDWTDVMAYGGILIIVFGLAFFLTDGMLTIPTTENGVVLERVFSAGKTGTGVGPVMNGGSSGTGMAVVITSTSDEWLAIVQTDSGVYKAHASKALWPYINKADRVIIKHNRGRFTKMIWSTKLWDIVKEK